MAYFTSEKMSVYQQNIQERSLLRFYLGLIPRLKQFIKHEYSRGVARRNGATLGKNVILPLALSKKANLNLNVGSNTSIQTSKIDLRCPVNIGSNVIIGNETEIITTSHNIDSPEWEHKYYGITIEDYVWIPTKVLILPSCQKIGRGAEMGSGSVVVKEVEEMMVVSGNPAKPFKKRRAIHSNLVVESLLAGDLMLYIKTWRTKGK